MRTMKTVFLQRGGIVEKIETEKRKSIIMVWLLNLNQQIVKVKRRRIWGGFLCWVLLMLFTPKLQLSPKSHLFADKRNFFGVPNTLNVITNFPFLVVGVLGFVLCLSGSFFNISSRWEIWGWALFYAGIGFVAFGSAHYHLKPEDNRVMWDTLPMMIAYSSLFSSFLVERVGERIGLSSLVSLLCLSVLSVVYASAFSDFRLCMTFQLIPCLAIPVLAFLFPAKYTHSRYWFWATGVYILSKIEAIADNKVYNSSKYTISGHSLGHLCSAAVPVLLTLMLMYRNIIYPRLGEVKERP